MRYNALKGVQDIFPPDIYIWQKAESLAKEVFLSYGFQEIRLPIIESTGLFVRSIGEVTDIVEKEMYTFSDKAGRSVTLRPEGTASVVRAYVENNLHTMPSPQKFFYSGPMFRYERPQKGRFRQFYQIGVEAFGLAAPEMDAEMVLMLRNLFEALGLTHLNFEVNSIGCDKCRPDYRKALASFFAGKINEFCPDCQRRRENNPLRILDCKVGRCIDLRKGAPSVTAFLCADCRGHFEKVLSILRTMSISHTVNPNMVRGLDYYTGTIFEVAGEHLGAQKAVAAGGRYDNLVEEFGGPRTPAIGFAIGMERLAALLKEGSEMPVPTPDIFIATIGERAITEGLSISEGLRSKGLWVEVGYERSSLKSQLRRADRLVSKYVFIIGDDELSSGKIKWKRLSDGAQGEKNINRLGEFVAATFSKGGSINA